MRRFAVAVIAVLAAGLCLAAPAAADIGYVPSPDSGATVTHLNLTGRRGIIGTTLTVGKGDRIIGLVIDIPEAGGTWRPVPKVTLPSGLVCTGNSDVGDGYSLPLYYCITPLEPNDIELHQNLPVGRYIVSLPIARPTGAEHGMTGTVALTRPDAYSPSYDSTLVDTFPVLAPGVDLQSSAEVTNLDLGTTGIGRLYVGDLLVHVLVKPGEQVTGVDVRLPTSATAAGSFTARDVRTPQGILCGEDRAHAPPPNTFVLRCAETHPHGAVWPSGAYSLKVRVAGIAVGPILQSESLAGLTWSGGATRTTDTFVATFDDYARAPRT